MTEVMLLVYSCGRSFYVVGENVANNSVDGKNLVDIGRKVDKPILSLLGTVIINLEDKYYSLKDKYSKISDKLCLLRTCNDWTEWSQCETSMHGGQFGIQKRNRMCDGNTKICKGDSSSEVQTESTICEQMCPNHYNSTYRGHCLKMYVNQKNRSDAENTCRLDGGHLVNIDSMRKVRDVQELLREHSVNSSGLWIDGIRSEGSHEWKYNVQPLDPTFTYWDVAQGEPHLSSEQLCKVFYFGMTSELWRWHDGVCTNKYIFACEIIRQ